MQLGATFSFYSSGANGQEHTGGADFDGNPSNDLSFDANGNIHCLTCHGVHFADSNSTSVDGP